MFFKCFLILLFNEIIPLCSGVFGVLSNKSRQWTSAYLHQTENIVYALLLFCLKIIIIKVLAKLSNFNHQNVNHFTYLHMNAAGSIEMYPMCWPSIAVPYAWDEPTLPPHITLRVQGGTSATYDMSVIGDGEKLCYENFIYIAFTHTFKRLVACSLCPCSLF